MPAAPDLIAETDETGRIAWIWRRGPNDRIARPIAEPAKYLNELHRSRFHGATSLAISDWFAKHTRGH